MADKVPLTPAHKLLRSCLLVLLALSAIFTASMGFAYAAFRHNWVDRDSMLPYIIKADIMAQKIGLLWLDQDARYEAADNLMRMSYVSTLYRETGKEIMEDLADEGHAPAQFAQANLLRYSFPLDENEKRADSYLQRAAAQGYAPAISALAQEDPSQIAAPVRR